MKQINVIKIVFRLYTYITIKIYNYTSYKKFFILYSVIWRVLQIINFIQVDKFLNQF